MKTFLKSLLFLLITFTFYTTINAQFCSCSIKTFDETINVSSGTQAIAVYVVAFTLDPTIVNYRLERTDANNNSQTITTIPATFLTTSSLFWRDVTIQLSIPFYTYKLIAERSFNIDVIVESTTHILLPTNSNINCVKINQLYRKACHNCFEPQFSPSFTTSLLATKVVELDIYAEDPKDNELSIGDWQVRHVGLGSVFSPVSGNGNNCGTGDQDLNFCLNDAIVFHNNFPNHDPIIMYIDLKKNAINFQFGGNFWKLSHRPHHLDDVLNDVGIENIYKPSDLKGNFAQLRFAAESQNWPTLGELRGKFIFVLTGNNKDLNSYLNELGDNALAFVAAKVDGGKDFFGNVNPPTYNALIHPKMGLWPQNEQHVVFYNLEKDQLGLARDFMPKHGFISRVYENGGTSTTEYGDYIYRQVNNIAIKNIFDNFPNIIMNDKILETNITNVVLGIPPSTMFIDSKYDHITQHALQTVTTQNLKVLAGTHYNISAGQEVRLKPGTEIKAGADTRIFISNCEDYIANMRVNPFANQAQSRPLTKQEIDWMLAYAKTTQDSNIVESATTNQISPTIYPNPTTGNLTISQLEQFAGGNIEITNLLGQTVFSQQINASTLNINLSNQPKGIYLVKISSQKESVVQKVVLE